MTDQPRLHTKRLILRPFDVADAAIVQRLAGSKAIADTTLNIPHPYPDGAAEEWISSHPKRYADRKSVIFAVAEHELGSVIGSIGLEISIAYAVAELGYWIGQPYWNQGYCTEAARRILAYAFDDLRLNRVQARHLTRNPASGRVMQKIGMSHEGHLRQAVMKWGKFEDLELYAVLKEEFIH